MSNALLVGINVWRASESVLIRPEAETRALVVYAGLLAVVDVRSLSDFSARAMNCGIRSLFHLKLWNGRRYRAGQSCWRSPRRTLAILQVFACRRHNRDASES